MVQYITHDEKAQLTLGYWGIRGLAQPIRFMLVCARVPFNEVRYGVHQDGTLMNKEQEDKEWVSEKAKFEDDKDMPFPNLPYLIVDETDADGGPVKLTQSNAILRYLARRYGFYGTNGSLAEQTQIDILQEEAYDFRNQIVETAYTLDPEDYKVAFENFKTQTLPKYLVRLEKYLSSSRSIKNKEQKQYCFFVGNQLSLVDFVLYELLWQMTKMVPGSVSTNSNKTPNICSFLEAFQAIPEIATYTKTKYYIQQPINSPWASFC